MKRRANEIKARQERARKQRLYLLDQTQSNASKICFKVLGSTNNVYKLYFGKENDWTCTCVDFYRRKSYCKHIYFVLERVLGLTDPNTNETWDKALGCLSDRESNIADASAELPTEYRPIYEAAVADEKRINISSTIENEEQKEKKTRRKEWLNVACLICTEEMDCEEDLEWCMQTCGNSVHKSCFARWVKHHGKGSCPMCRSAMGSSKLPTRKKRLRLIRLDIPDD